jgi:hypothetical protein
MLSERQIRAVEQQLRKSYASAEAEERTFLQSVLELLKRVGGDTAKRLALHLAEYVVTVGIRKAVKFICTTYLGFDPPFWRD